MPDFRSLEVLYWAAHLQSFRKAAERLNTTQPAVSQRISALESEFGARLFERTSRSISVTAKGRALVEYAERFLRLRADMMSALATPAAMSGVVRLGVSETIVHTWLARFIERAHAVYPNIVIDISVDVSPVMRNALVDREIDMAFLLGPVSEPNMSNLPLCDYPLAFVAAPGLVLGPEPLSHENILAYPLITYPKSTAPYLLLYEGLSAPHLPSPRIFSNSSLSTIVRMTMDKIGLSVIPPVVISAELARGDLRLVETALTLPALNFTATYPIQLGGGLAAPLAQLAREIAVTA
ncbi:LysR family transcriptional regulator [Terrarubrum flagellatum]|uniref:LysR family transcriptional regulator n=1 Tax=Terrirubrum flagellatum TaxID=2895980 RepID=UPI0031451DD3